MQGRRPLSKVINRNPPPIRRGHVNDLSSDVHTELSKMATLSQTRMGVLVEAMFLWALTSVDEEGRPFPWNDPRRALPPERLEKILIEDRILSEWRKGREAESGDMLRALHRMDNEQLGREIMKRIMEAAARDGRDQRRPEASSRGVFIHPPVERRDVDVATYGGEEVTRDDES
jgi:hypothetical protein